MSGDAAVGRAAGGKRSLHPGPLRPPAVSAGRDHTQLGGRADGRAGALTEGRRRALQPK